MLRDAEGLACGHHVAEAAQTKNVPGWRREPWCFLAAELAGFASILDAGEDGANDVESNERAQAPKEHCEGVIHGAGPAS